MKLRHLLIALLWSPLFALAAETPNITPAEAAKRVAAGTAVIVDVREPSEWAESGVAAPAALLAKSDFDGAKTSWTPFLKENAGKEVILYCRGGGRAGAVAEALAATGVKVANIGGFRDWEKAGLPTRKVEPKK